MSAQPRACLRECYRARLADETGATVGDDLERPAGVRRRQHRFLGEECLVRNHAEVLVDRCVVDDEAACIEVGELLLVDTSGEARPSVEPEPLRGFLQALPIRAIADDDAAERRVCGERVQEQIVPLGPVEAADREDKVLVAFRSVRQLLRRMRHHLRRQPGRSLEPLGDVPGRGEDLPRLAERHTVEPLHRPSRRSVLCALAELAELGAVELIRLAELVQQPHDLARMTHRVRRELRRDHEVDCAPVRLVEIEEPPEKRLAEHALARVPLVRHRHEVDLVVARAQLGDEIVSEDLGTAARKGHLRRADGDPHAAPTRGTRATNRDPPRPPTDSVGRKDIRVRKGNVPGSSQRITTTTSARQVRSRAVRRAARSVAGRSQRSKDRRAR